MGWHVPYDLEWKNLHNVWCGANPSTCSSWEKFSTYFKLPPAQSRSYDSKLLSSLVGRYWTSSPEDSNHRSWSIQIHEIFDLDYSSRRSAAMSIRCFKN